MRTWGRPSWLAAPSNVNTALLNWWILTCLCVLSSGLVNLMQKHWNFCMTVFRWIQSLRSFCTSVTRLRSLMSKLVKLISYRLIDIWHPWYTRFPIREVVLVLPLFFLKKKTKTTCEPITQNSTFIKKTEMFYHCTIVLRPQSSSPAFLMNLKIFTAFPPALHMHHCVDLQEMLSAKDLQVALSQGTILKILEFKHSLLSTTLSNVKKKEIYLWFRTEGCSTFHLHPPSSVILVTCFVSLFEISSHLFMSLRTTSLSFSRVLQFHTMSSDKPAVLVIFESYKN